MMFADRLALMDRPVWRSGLAPPRENGVRHAVALEFIDASIGNTQPARIQNRTNRGGRSRMDCRLKKYSCDWQLDERGADRRIFVAQHKRGIG
jgi:hypothetical protein